MKNSTIYKRSLVYAVLVFCGGFVLAQNSYKETFTVAEDAVVNVNTSHTNVVFETWNKDKVEVEAFVEGENLSEKEKQEIFDNWKFDVMGNSKKVNITSNSGSLWGDFETLGSLNSLDNLGSLVNMSSLEALKGLEGLGELGEIFTADWNINVPEIPEMEAMPMWPFGEQNAIIKKGDSYKRFNYKDKASFTFDRDTYEKDKKAYVNKLNKKYGANATVKETDKWLKDLDTWSEDLEKRMEDWGNQFGKSFEENFGPDFEKRMEAWGENFGKQFEKQMEAWGENFGKDMEKWGAQFEKEAEEWAKQFDGNYKKEEIIDENGNKTTIIRSSNTKSGLLDKPNKKVKKTIIIRMPKNTKTDINVRHGEIKMADVTNVRATLNYAALTANSIDGGKTLINAAYAPVHVNYWGDGALAIQYVENCKLNSVNNINLQTSSSNVVINELKKTAYVKGFIGSLFVNNVSSNFTTIDLVLDDTNATIDLPSTSYTFFFNGRKSTLQYPKSLEATNSKEYGRILVRGFNSKKDAPRSLTINANYSNVRLQ
ncbi:hypothetical protein [Marinirhabdus gelatinilytica]|uniref:Uncharacterized protein n=1 Tax=Marinirhabdus gelatinilytica TaxID=1703343 RepID=A0A370Q8U5_9FLAO|nr:hypothetical protein [Marinirhabdus gelatinilytica]RDK84785.1 hypothetical protein C8D94_104158 [Marinirhabdus gelatinilytica]